MSYVFFQFKTTNMIITIIDFIRLVEKTLGWSPKFSTGLNVIIGVDQKIYKRPSYSFAKMMYILLVTLKLFELPMPIMILIPVANLGDQSLIPNLFSFT